MEQIAQAALDEGVASFSMPSVARRLGVAHSGLYRYVADREALLLTAIDRAINTIEWPSADQPWDDLLRAVGETLWDLSDRYPGVDRATLTASHAPPAAIRLIEGYVEQLHRDGFSLEDAAVAVNFVISVTMTASADMARLRRAGHSTVAKANSATLKAYDADEAHADRGWYDRKLDIVLRGIAPLRMA